MSHLPISPMREAFKPLPSHLLMCDVCIHESLYLAEKTVNQMKSKISMESTMAAGSVRLEGAGAPVYEPK